MGRRLWAAATVLTMAGLTCGSLAGSSVASAGVRASFSNPGGPIIRASGGNSTVPTISLNWSGYAATTSSTSTFSYVGSKFVQPKIKCHGVRDQFTSEWVGLDGFTNSTVEQDGTAAWCGGKHGTVAHYEAWYELFPAASVNVFRVRPGDRISALVNYSGGVFTLTIADLTTHKSKTHTATCAACKRSSAEWIIERPALCNSKETKCFLTELADFRKTKMSDDVAAVNGGAAQGISSFVNTPVYMIGLLKKGFISLDTVNPLNSAGDAFTANWDRSGSLVRIKL
jgi:Peptidase A4 family